jgi:magnesium-transporting ATPase (P-type)
MGDWDGYLRWPRFVSLSLSLQLLCVPFVLLPSFVFCVFPYEYLSASVVVVFVCLFFVETKLSLNQKDPQSKFSSLDKRINKYVIGLFVFQCVLCAGMALQASLFTVGICVCVCVCVCTLGSVAPISLSLSLSVSSLLLVLHSV